MARYILKFSKEGYIKYTSHLDMLRLFKRAFKKTGLDLLYSHGFNPHPKMSFAQPLSLGYTSICELLDFETKDSWDVLEIKDKLNAVMPEGIVVLECKEETEDVKTIAARCSAAEYIIAIPVDENCSLTNDSVEEFLNQNSILAMKKKKKSKELKEVDIKDKINQLSLYIADNKLFLSTNLDAGSNSNLSPELLIQAFTKWADIPLHRENVEILRKKLII